MARLMHNGGQSRIRTCFLPVCCRVCFLKHLPPRSGAGPPAPSAIRPSPAALHPGELFSCAAW